MKNIEIGILSERRVLAPYGMNGGEDGERGLNLLIKKGENDDEIINLGGKVRV